MSTIRDAFNRLQGKIEAAKKLPMVTRVAKMEGIIDEVMLLLDVMISRLEGLGEHLAKMSREWIR